MTDVRVYCQLYGKLKLLMSNILHDFGREFKTLSEDLLLKEIPRINL